MRLRSTSAAARACLRTAHRVFSAVLTPASDPRCAVSCAPASQLTGPAASPEHLPALTTADHYREHSPGSPPFVVSIPHARPETTFDIKYYTRDRRRTFVNAYNPGSVKTEAFVVTPAMGPITEPLPTAGTRAAVQQWYAGKRARKVDLTDDANNGYT